MEDNKKLFLVAIISVLILFGWDYFYEGPRRMERERYAEQQRIEAIATKQAQKESGIADSEVTTAFLPRKELVTENDRILVETERLHGSIALKGARFDDLVLKKYRQSLEETADPVVLFSPSKTVQSYFVDFGWIADNKNINVPNKETVWSADKEVLTEKDSVHLYWDNGQGIRFGLDIDVDENYMFNVKQTIENLGESSVSLRPYGLVNRLWKPMNESYVILHEGPIGVLNNELNEFRYEDMIEDTPRTSFKDTDGWVGISDKYWLTVLRPAANGTFDVNFTASKAGEYTRFQSDYLAKYYDINPGEKKEFNVHLFAGAKKIGLLDAYSKQHNIPLLDRAVDFGVLYFFTKPLFKILNYLNSLIGSFGLAILLLTVLVKLVLFPLANKSFVSIHKMKLLQPQLVTIKERFKGKPAELNQEVMKLYKREKVSPLSGCLPLFIQIPVFFALYKVLFITIEMRHAPFYGWVKDLSANDPTTIFNLFGLIPWQPPEFLMIGGWAIIMCITMIIQQKMSAPPTDPTQAKVMKALPYVFCFIFARFPAGLIIYWAWNNVLSLLQQWFITRKLKAPST